MGFSDFARNLFSWYLWVLRDGRNLMLIYEAVLFRSASGVLCTLKEAIVAVQS